MSRLAGIVSDDQPEKRDRLLDQMLQALSEKSLGSRVWSPGSELGPQASSLKSQACDVALGFWGTVASGMFVSSTVAVAIDGYIYNLSDFRDLGGEGDAALIASLYLREGLPAALQKLNGDFALVLYDF